MLNNTILHYIFLWNTISITLAMCNRLVPIMLLKFTIMFGAKPLGFAYVAHIKFHISVIMFHKFNIFSNSLTFNSKITFINITMRSF